MKRKKLLSFLGIIACLLLSMPVVGEEAWKDKVERIDAKTLKFHLTLRAADYETVSIDMENTYRSGEISHKDLDATSYIYYKEWTGSAWGPEVPVLYYGTFDKACERDRVKPQVCVEASKLGLDKDKKGVMAITKPADSSSVVGTFEVTNSLLSKYYDYVEWGWEGLSNEYSRANGFTQHCLDYDTSNPYGKLGTYYMDVAWTLPGSLSGKKIMIGVHRVPYFPTSSLTRASTAYEFSHVDLLPYFFYDYVNFGLPSGTLWASHNVGATKPEEFGNYYAWGEVEPKDSYTAENYKWGTQLNHYTKYQNDGRLILEMLDNAASMNWGALWSMPTKAQFEELSNSCNITWTQLNGVDGYRFTSKTDDSKSIFIPAAGQKWMDNSHSVCLFSKEIDNIEEGSVWRFKAENGEPFTIASTVYRPIGLPIRPVKTSNQTAQDLLLIGGTAIKTEYYVSGESFDVSGLDVYFLPKEGSAEKVTKNVTWTINPAILKKGDQSVTVTASYDGVTSDPMEIPITFKELKPFFSQEEGSFADKVEVTMTSDVEGATIYYTLDGTTPTTKSTVYTKPITINSSVTVNAIAVFGNLTSEVASASYIKVTAEYVDLGLPSGTLWAIHNVGAASPEECGNYYAWGEVNTKDEYIVKNYLFTNHDYGYPSFVKYFYGDGRTVLEQQDDAAYMNMGPRCHMPAADNYNELINNCTFQWITVGGQDGCLFTSKINGNVLFFPAGDYKRNGAVEQHCVYYWASTIGDAAGGYADRFEYNPSGTPNVAVTTSRYYGAPVRAVKLLKPFFSPEGCSFVDKMEVEMTSGREGATIYFTLDGTTPTTKSTVYVKPITINTSVTVKAIAVLGNTTSEVASASYIKISDYVDLGLPSGNLWASHNIGATKPEDRGTKVSWGETTDKHSSLYKDYKWRVEGGNEDSDYSKYNKEDGKTVLEPQDDAAYMNLGPRWCMPTTEDFQELLDNCSSIYTTVGGENGWLFTSNVNGNGLFFPFAYYWSSTIGHEIYYASYLDCYRNTSGAYVGTYSRRYFQEYVRAIIRHDNINTNEGVYISGAPGTTSYLAGSVFDVAGLDVYYVKEGAASTKVTEEATWTFDPAVIPVGCKFVTVTASYKGLTSTPIKVAITTDDFAPVFTPAAGSYEGIKAVTISCADKNAKIYYTLDGSTPTTSSAQYTEPIIVGDTATIKAFVVNGDKQSNVMSASYTITQPDYVDLGLSSGLRWASKNVGAAKIEDYGKYYAWGDPTDKTNFTWSTYPYGSNNSNCFKYKKDDKWTLEPQDDAAYIHYGPRWHTPTQSEFQELFDECDAKTITYQNTQGLLLTGSNGNSIFLPFAGYMKDNTSVVVGAQGDYWTSSVQDMVSGYVYKWVNAISGGYGNRNHGFSVRPVMNADKESVTEGIYIKGQTHTTSCYAGDAFDLSKLNVYYIKEGGISENVTGSATLTASPSVIPVGCTSVTVTASYKGMQATSVKVTIATKVREIDLGLTKRWAEFNLGTCIPTEYGNYYTWSDSLKNNKVAATLGSGWELPTREDVKELQDTTKCVWKWFEPGNTAYGGVAGYRVTGKRTGNSIFLPAAGTMSNSYFIGGGQVGNYWTSETGPQPLLDSYYMCFDRYDQCTGVDSQTNGKSVRAVKK